LTAALTPSISGFDRRRCSIRRKAFPEPSLPWYKTLRRRKRNRAIDYDDIVETSILGYYALAAAFILTDELSLELGKRYPRQIPVTRLGRLAVRRDLQGQGLGRLLLADAVTRSRNAALSVGSAGIFVDAMNDAAAHFYRQYGFIPCRGQSLKLYLPM
jgi:GNAT superfamily N-acetyltransferase